MISSAKSFLEQRRKLKNSLAESMALTHKWSGSVSHTVVDALRNAQSDLGTMSGFGLEVDSWLQNMETLLADGEHMFKTLKLFGNSRIESLNMIRKRLKDVDAVSEFIKSLDDVEKQFQECLKKI